MLGVKVPPFDHVPATFILKPAAFNVVPAPIVTSFLIVKAFAAIKSVGVPVVLIVKLYTGAVLLIANCGLPVVDALPI